MEFEPQQQKILQAVDQIAAEAVSISHQIHEHPETAFQEHFAARLLTDTLRKHHFTIEPAVADMPTAFRASAGTGEPKVAFLAEFDALAELGHACGHNVIAAVSTAAGMALSAVLDEVPGQVLVIGTPAEEGPGAKIPMMKRGVFDGLDAAMMVHPYVGNFIATHSLSMEEIRIKFHGRAAHAVSSPWAGNNALDALLLAFNSINALRQQLRPDSRVHGVITNGGSYPGVIPATSEAHFFIHAADRAYLSEVIQKFKSCAEGAAIATGTRVDFHSYDYQFDNMVNNMELASRVRDYMVEFGSGPFGTMSDFFGPIDLGNLSHVIPCIHLLVNITDGNVYSPHTEEFCSSAVSSLADEVLLRSTRALALTGLDVLRNPAFLRSIQSEFSREIGHPPLKIH